ncbi:UNVERIFIED_CONTAM: RNA polymerase sigma factor [Acetivibrio alkalicellulosi]
MGAILKNKRDENFNNNILCTINRIKNGDHELREEFINSFKPYIIKTVSNLSGKYVDVQNSDEFSIGLSAFNEAIDSFNPCKSMVFFSFSTLVIKRRLTDYVRRNKKHSHVYPFTYFEDKGISFFDQAHFRNEAIELNSYEILLDTKNFIKKLSTYGIKFEDLINKAPKHQDSKYLCLRIAKVIADDKKLLDKLGKTGRIPKAEILKCFKINKKTLERNRIFIIAAALILGSELHTLRDFVTVSD